MHVRPSNENLPGYTRDALESQKSISARLHSPRERAVTQDGGEVIASHQSKNYAQHYYFSFNISPLHE